ncbi:MAG: tetratricopeptide repeat protein [bacterium]|nr:tetratricopeptide repeat protein [bacterium]
MKKTSFTPLIIFLFIVVLGTFLLVNWGYFYPKNKPNKRSDNTLYTLSLKHSKKKHNNIAGVNPGIENLYYNKVNLRKNLTIIRALLAEGDIEEAQNNLRTLLLFYPENKTVLSLLGGIYYLSGEYESAKNIFNRILILYPEDILARENIGLIFEKKGQYDKAINEFIKVLTISKESAIPYLHLAGIYSVINKKNKAIYYFQIAHSLLGNKIIPISYDPVYNNIRNMPEFIVMTQEPFKKSKTDLKK